MRRSLTLLFLMGLILAITNCSRGHIDNSQYDTGKMIIKTGELTDVFKAPAILADDTKIYIWDKFLGKICIYLKKNLKKIAEFGKRGEGPAEFSVIQKVLLTDKYIYVSSFPKLTRFSKEGKFIKETIIRNPAGFFLPIGENFIGSKKVYASQKSKKDKIIYRLFDSNLIRIKDIFETEFMREVNDIKKSRMKLLWFKDCYKGVVYKDRFYVGSTDRGFYFAIFDEHGNKLDEINGNFERIKVTADFKETIFKKIRESDFQQLKRFIKKREIVFPEYFPAYSNFAVDNDMIYVFKYPTSLNKNKASVLEVLVFDLKGNLIRRAILPASFWRALSNNDMYFHDGDLYFIDISENNDKTAIFQAKLQYVKYAGGR